MQANRGDRTRAFLTWTITGLALWIHGYAVVSIVRQPLGVERAPPELRSLVWPLHNDTVHRMGPAADFFAVSHAGRNLEEGHSPYNLKESPRITPYYFEFRYLPIVAQTLGRAALLPDKPLHAWHGWVVMVEIILALFIFVFRRRARSVPLISTLGTCLALVSSPYLLELHMGQFTFATTALVLIGVMVHVWPVPRDRAPRLTAVIGTAAYTAAVLLKVFPLVAVPALARARRCWPFIVVALAVTVIVSVPYFLSSPSDWETFYRLNFSGPKGGMDSGNYGFFYLIQLTGHEAGLTWSQNTWFGVASIFRITVLGLSLLLVLATRSQQLVTMVCLMLLAHFVSYVHVWEHHMSGVVLIGLVLLVALHRDKEPTTMRQYTLVIAAVVMLALPTPYALVDAAKDPSIFNPDQAWSFAVKAALVASKALPTVLMYGICVYLMCRAGLRWSFRRQDSG